MSTPDNSTNKAGLAVLIVILLLMVLPFLFITMYFPFGVHHGIRLPFVFIPAILLLIVWFVLVIWVYFDAQKRGLNGLLWGILVWFGSIIGLVIYLLVRSGSMPGITTPNQGACLQCGRLISHDFMVCPYCGAAQKETCPSCKRIIAPDWQVCPYCQHKLRE
ncbi:zinc ribbon domain-containing protein [candidate division KSB1 bacterium]|nr:zinc ribbon domain-containing protein [candidate division KSB1 bacterium]